MSQDKAGTPLPEDARQQVQAQGGADAEALEALATSPALGAPKADEEKTDNAIEAGGDRKRPSPVGAAAAAPAEGDDTTMAILLASLGVLSAVAAGIALKRRKSQAR